ncbi:ATP-binding protein [Kitasatospora azatica]|uniref:ATP-binding protein n=1 Tax=Kitasatospora azatica TaxID=58347 RepID=UPI00068F4DB8|nr:ATP-binding protein [Kitasatospora azatica]
MVTDEATRSTAPVLPGVVCSPASQFRAACAMSVSVAAVPALRRFARDSAKRWSLPTGVVDQLCLVVSELVTNVVLHSGSPDVTVLISVENGSLTLEVRDTGRWRPRPTRRRVAEDADAAYGRGLDLVRLCSSWTRAGITPAGTRMVACLPLAAPVR